MGNLVNPIGTVFTTKVNLFWINNYGFFYDKHKYKRYFFLIKCLNKFFKFLAKTIENEYVPTKIDFNWTYNFVGQNNKNLYIQLNLRKYYSCNESLMNRLRKDIDADPNSIIDRNSTGIHRPFPFQIVTDKTGFTKMIDKGGFCVKAFITRYIFIYRRWRLRLMELLLRSVFHIFFSRSRKNEFRKRIKHDFKRRFIRKYFKRFWLEANENLWKRNDIKKEWSNYFNIKMKLSMFIIKMMQKLIGKPLRFIVTFFIQIFLRKFMNLAGLNFVKIKFARKLQREKNIVDNIINFSYWCLEKKFKVPYIAKKIRKSFILSKDVIGIKMVLTGRFFRRGRAMYSIIKMGRFRSLSNLKRIFYSKREKIEDLGLCSIKLLLFFKKSKNKRKSFLRYLKKNYHNLAFSRRKLNFEG